MDRKYDSHGVVIPRGGEYQCVHCPPGYLFGGLDSFDRHVRADHAAPSALGLLERDRGGAGVWVEEWPGEAEEGRPWPSERNVEEPPAWWPKDWSA